MAAPTLDGMATISSLLPDGAAQGLADINPGVLQLLNITLSLTSDGTAAGKPTESGTQAEPAKEPHLAFAPAPGPAHKYHVGRRGAGAAGWLMGGLEVGPSAPSAAGAPDAMPGASFAEADVDEEGGAGPSGRLVAESSAWWAGRRLMQPDDVDAQQEAGSLPAGSYLTGRDFDNLTDYQLLDIFTNGVADTPSALPGEVGNWTFCVGNGLFNAFTNSSWPRGVWPQGNRSPLKNFANRVWRGNTLYTDPATNQTVVVNMLLSNSSVAWISTNVTNRAVGISPDKKPSVVISYVDTELLPTRFFNDELRRVGPNIWLARAWWLDVVPSLLPSDPLPLTQPLVDIAKSVGNSTYNLAVEALGIQGPNSSPTTSGFVYPEPGEPLNAFWFMLECVNDAVPKLFYLPVSYAGAAVGSLTGYYPPFYMLPGLNPTAGQFSVENWSQEFPTAVEGPDYPPFILWPWKWSDIGPIGYLKLPALPLEFINGVWFLYNPTAPGDPTFQLLPFAATAPSPSSSSSSMLAPAPGLSMPAVNFTEQVIQATQDLTRSSGVNFWMAAESSSSA